ncbi:MAG TPA: VOC family protein [Roseobacter sp.]|nr:VOC family protein [Roseobacter sp.]HEC71343.1 VOC family protein [Roseobacter sp.]
MMPDIQAKQHIMGLTFAGLEVNDLEVSKTFYRDVLGFSEAPAVRPDAVIMKTADGLGSFALKQPSGDGPKSATAVALWFACDDVDALADRARKAGAPVPLAPQNGPFGKMTVVVDPNGHSLTFHNA